LIFVLAFSGAVEAASPVRLQIVAQPGTVRQGGQVRIDVQFLGRNISRSPRCQSSRAVHLAALDSFAAGSITPAISVQPGVTHSADAVFQCRAPGRFRIIARSAGLVEAQTIVVGVPRGTSRIENWLVPSVLAAGNQTIQIFPTHPQQGLIANGRSRVGLKLVLRVPLRKENRWRFCSPPRRNR